MRPILARYWLAAALAQFAKSSDWRSWADGVITSSTKPPLWIIEMSLAMTLSELKQALSTALDEGPDVPWSLDNTLIGYVWWRFEKGEITLKECLVQAGEISDGGSSRIPCESIYGLLNKLEEGIPTQKEVEASAREMVSPLKELAEEQWNQIHST